MKLHGPTAVSLCEGGYLFSSLLLPRALSVGLQKITPFYTRKAEGLGAWNHGDRITQLIQTLLQIENRWLLEINRWGLHIPGLSVWALCRKK